MKNYRQPLLTIFVIFATAYILTIMGCSGSANAGKKAMTAETQQTTPAPVSEQNPDENGNLNPTENLAPIDPKDLRECTNEEFSALVKWSLALESSDKAISAMGKPSDWKKSSQVISLASDAIQKCDEAKFYHSLKPCKKTTAGRRTVTDPNPKTEVRSYDAYRIQKRCEQTESYLKKFNARPTAGAVVPPVRPQPPVVVDPQEPANPGALRSCSAEEFSKLNAWRAALDAANKSLAAFGGAEAWKFNASTLNATKNAAQSCEVLMAYHQDQPCQREKSYTRDSIKQQCQAARTYYYNFAQKTESLIVPSARLLLDTKMIAGKIFEPGPAAMPYGQCVITNQTDAAITYQGQRVLVTEARVYTDDLKMFVLVTAEGLKLECYGMDYTSAATSVTEVVRLLRAMDTDLPLSYELN